MTTVAKIFVFIVLIGSIAFAMTALVMVRNSQDWKAAHKELEGEFEEARGIWKKDMSDLQKLFDDAKQARDTMKQQLHEKEAEVGSLQVRLRTEEANRKAAETRNEALAASVNKINDDLEKLVKDNKTLRDEKEDFRLKCEAAIRAREKAEDDLSSCKEDLLIEKKKTEQLANELGVTQGVVNKYEEVAPKIVVERDKPEMPDIVGKVIKVDSQKGIVLISVGSDDRVQEKFTFEVFRPGQYVGRIRVFEVFEERAICRIDPTMTNTPIMENDHVSTRLP